MTARLRFKVGVDLGSSLWILAADGDHYPMNAGPGTCLGTLNLSLNLGTSRR